MIRLLTVVMLLWASTIDLTAAEAAADNSGSNYMKLSFAGLFVAGASTETDISGLQLGSHDPSRRGFSVQNAELVLSGAVDPYFTAQANIVFVEAPDGETVIELEEFYAETSSLPANLEVKAGHFYTEFGRLNPQHPHSWDFVDAPLSHTRMFGADGLRSSGVRVAWLAPTPFYSEIYLTVQNAFGETLTSFGSTDGETAFGLPLGMNDVHSSGDLLYTPRYAASFDSTDNQTWLLGVSGAFGPNGTGDDGSTSLYGLDVFWKWKSPRAQQGFPFLKVQTEALQRRYKADDGIALMTFDDWGGYSQIVWGFKRGWTVGARYGSMGGDDGGDTTNPVFEDRTRASLSVTWFATEYSKLRLQYSHDYRDVFEDANSVWLQFQFSLGAHAAHKY